MNLKEFFAVLALALSVVSPGLAASVLVLNQSNNVPALHVAQAIGDLGHTVTTVPTLDSFPDDLDQFDTIWHMGFGALSADAQQRLIAYVQSGGGLYLTGISEVASINDGIDNILNALLTGGPYDAQASSESGLSIEASVYNPEALEGVTDGLSMQDIGIAGIILGIDQTENVLLHGFETQTPEMLHDIGGIWNEENMQSGNGRMILVMDHEWVSGVEEPIVQVFHTFLAQDNPVDLTCRADCDNTGTVDFNDLICVLFEFGDCPTPE